MKNPNGEQSSVASTPTLTKKPVEPKFPALPQPPESVEALFISLAVTVEATVEQPDPTGKRGPKKQHYATPWAGFQSWHDARARLNHFEKTFKGDIAWAPFNDTVANDGPMSLNAYPGRAFVERVTNEGDAVLEAKAAQNKGAMPESPAKAVELWFGLGPSVLATGLSDDAARDLAQKTVTVTGFVGDSADHKDSVFDARDYGIGLSASEMPSTILSLNRGNKKQKAWLTGKHGQGASSTYQYSDLTLIASRKAGTKCVAFTLVEASWDGPASKTPTYRYLTINGQVPEVEISEKVFRPGTLVRHIGYTAADLGSLIGESSLYGLLMRSLAEPLFPVWLEMFSLRARKSAGYPTFLGYRQHRRLIRGTVNALERAWAETLKSTPNGEGPTAEDSVDQPLEGEETGEERGTRILHRASEYFDLPKWNYGGRTGVAELGRVRINDWVADPAARQKKNLPLREWRDVLRNWVDPDKTVVMTLDGQTHAEEARAIVTGMSGAKLWAVGKYMVVQVDCNGLDPHAKYEMFTSTREHAKETPIKKMILEELVRRLSMDEKLKELNVQLAAADIKQPENSGATISSLIKKYLKAAGISFEQLTRKVEKWVELEQDVEVPASKKELVPISAVEPPTFIRWRFSGTTVKMHPGQRYSFVFETDAAPSYWNPADQSVSKIKVTAHALRYVGAGEMKGGRVRCHFECAQDAMVGAKGFIQVQLEFAIGAAKTHSLPIEIVDKPKPKEKTPPADEPLPDDKETRIIRIKVRRRDFSEVDIPVVQPQPVKMSDQAWATLGWPHDPAKVGFSIRQLGGKIQLYYNVEFPPFLDMKQKMSKKSLESEFVRRYELKLILHTIFTLNYEFFDEDEFLEEQKKQVRNLLCATAESLALATKSELEIEAKVKSEDAAPVDTFVAADLKQAAVSAASEAASTP